jgi:peptidoglycan hydrolase CwlO-like protein
MSMAKTYSGHSWIKVPQFRNDESLTIEDRLAAFTKHHISETTFLIAEVRKLAQEIDTLNGQIENKDAIITKLTKERAELSHQLDVIDASDLVW